MSSHAAAPRVEEPVQLISPIHSSSLGGHGRKVISFCRAPDTESFRALYCQQLYRPQCSGPSSPASWCCETKCSPLVFITLLVSWHMVKLLSQNYAACSILCCNLPVHMWISLLLWSHEPDESQLRPFFIIVKGIVNEAKHKSHPSCIAWYTCIL